VGLGGGLAAFPRVLVGNGEADDRPAFHSPLRTHHAGGRHGPSLDHWDDDAGFRSAAGRVSMRQTSANEAQPEAVREPPGVDMMDIRAWV
jgi:hypothetical protein